MDSNDKTGVIYIKITLGDEAYNDIHPDLIAQDIMPVYTMGYQWERVEAMPDRPTMNSKDYTPLVITDYIHETFRVKHDAEPDGFAHGIGAINVANHVRDIYEAARQQDHATIEALRAEVEARHSVMMDRINFLHEDTIAQVEANRERLIRLEASVAAIRSGATFMQELEQDKPTWVPKVGDWVAVTGPNCIGHILHAIGSVHRVSETSPSGRVCAFCNFGNVWHDINTVRPATPEEVAEQEQAITPKFGDLVEYDGMEWRVGCDEPTDGGLWRLCPKKAGSLNTDIVHRSNFRIIDPQP